MLLWTEIGRMSAAVAMLTLLNRWIRVKDFRCAQIAIVAMADISIRGLDEDVKSRLRLRAAAHGQSMEAEAREILANAVMEPRDKPDLFDALMRRFDELGGVTLDIPARQRTE